jgi:ribonucleoside-diphosphate reductase subunit M2
MADLSTVELIKLLDKKVSNSNLTRRNSFFPIQDREAYEFYKTQSSNYWTADELDFTEDKKHYDSLSTEERNILDLIFGFFAAADGIITRNIVFRFLLERSNTLETQAFYIAQMAIEVIHAETYSLTIDTLITSPKKRQEVFQAAENIPCVRAKEEWMEKYMYSDTSFAERLVAFACAEGIFFISAFMFIFWFKSRGIFPNVILSNKLIAKDENLHRDFAIMLYRRLPEHLEESKIQEIVSNAVELECAFVDEVIPQAIKDLKPQSLKDYVRFLADDLLVALGHQKRWNIPSNSIPNWMHIISMETKVNFYERRNDNYQQFSLKESLDWEGRIQGNRVDEKAYTDPLAIKF